MNKLLVITPTGEQQVIEVGEGGGYFDAGRVLWDEERDGLMPEITLNGMKRVGASLVFDADLLAQYQASIVIPVPSSVSPRQIRQALTRAGLRTAVETAVLQGDQDLKDWWEFSTTFERNHPQVIIMAAALNVSNQQLDDLWILAGSLS